MEGSACGHHRNHAGIIIHLTEGRTATPVSYKTLLLKIHLSLMLSGAGTCVQSSHRLT